jgi:hypothetical protein
MAAEFNTPEDVERRLSAATSDRVAEMTDEERVALARTLAGRRKAVADRGFRQSGGFPYHPGLRPRTEPDQEQEAAIVRLTAELHKTERRIDQLERGFRRSRYQMNGGGGPDRRYLRLLRRADRLERQLRALGRL